LLRLAFLPALISDDDALPQIYRIAAHRMDWEGPVNLKAYSQGEMQKLNLAVRAVLVFRIVLSYVPKKKKSIV
jgi:uncharacterized protein Smg (DUF494 family)